MIWDTMPEKVTSRYKWENGILYLNKKELSNYYVKPIKWIKCSSNEKYIEIQYIIGEEETAFSEIVDFSQRQDLPIPTSLCDECIHFLRTASKELLILLKLQLNNSIPEEGYYIDSLGWQIINSHWIYCIGDKILSQNEAENIYINPKIASNFHIRYDDSIPEDNILKLIKKLICFNNSAIHICLLYLVTSLLRKIFFEVNIAPKFVLYISGETATYKTTLANYFFDIYNEGKGVSRASADLTSSESALRSIISEFKDCAFILDDLSKSVSPSETKVKEKTVNNFIRTTANCEENNKKTGKRVIGKLSQCGIVITAEYVLTMESIINRTILVDMNKFPLNKEILDFFQENELLMHSFSYMFLEWSVKNIELISDLIKSNWNQYRKQDIKEFNPRIRDSMYILSISYNVMLKYLKENGHSKLNTLFSDSMNSVLTNEQNKLDQIRSQNKTYNIVKEVANLFINKQIQPYPKIFQKSKNPSCWVEKGYIYIRTDILICELQKVIKNDNITSNKVSAALKKEGILELDNSGDSTVKKEGVRCYRIIIENLAEVAETSIEVLLPNFT